MIVYIVQPGDTLSMIAQRFDVSTREIIENNVIRNDLTIFPGQVLFITRRDWDRGNWNDWNNCDNWDKCPPHYKDPCPPNYGDLCPPYYDGSWPPWSDSCPDGRRRIAYYVVQRGDTLTRIASLYDTTVDAIVNANNLEGPNAIIYPGQVVKIPVRKAGAFSTEDAETTETE